jgi:hypothetical protein
MVRIMTPYYYVRYSVAAECNGTCYQETRRTSVAHVSADESSFCVVVVTLVRASQFEPYLLEW